MTWRKEDWLEIPYDDPAKMHELTAGDCYLVHKPDERRIGPYTVVAYWGEWPGKPEGWIAAAGRPLSGRPLYYLPLGEDPPRRPSIPHH